MMRRKNNLMFNKKTKSVMLTFIVGAVCGVLGYKYFLDK